MAVFLRERLVQAMCRAAAPAKTKGRHLPALRSSAQLCRYLGLPVKLALPGPREPSLSEPLAPLLNVLPLLPEMPVVAPP
jgi:hypothetical protein